MVSEPKSEAELIERAQQLAGFSVEQIASQIGWDVPDDLRHNKGWLGQLLEAALGATAQSRPEPDFQFIGVELKTLPVVNGQVKESTYVCHIDLDSLASDTWQHSLVKKKLNRVCWVPVDANPTVKLAERMIGMPLLYSPTSEDLAVLKQDWQELTDQMTMGEVESVSAYQGQWLQVRPKAANSRARSLGINERGQRYMTLPRGFYLRTSFTQKLLDQYYLPKI